ncbi:MAG TPA: hypothetical protein ENO00_13050 [Deltaproteobacteria bacterium]|nr:hypothetical protein [Deltaproteobacteria bacterium]
MLKIAAIVAITIAIVIAGYMFIFTEKQHSSLYIIPESYLDQTPDNTIFFTYGVICSEKEATDYEIQIFLNDVLVATDQIRLSNNERYEKNERLELTENVSSPVQIEVFLTNKENMNIESVHFRIELST